jgi:2-C-methyl-D-erythritol 4-phosphate cytidylyltransferase
MAAHGHETVAAILVAGGSGQRLGAPVPKAFVEVAGRTLLAHALATFRAHAAIDQLIVVAPRTHVDAAAELAGTAVVPGGDTRQASVRAGLAALERGVDFVLIHDVARPFVPVRVIDAVLDALRAGAEAAVPIVPIHDTVRSVDAGGALGCVVDRATLAAVQTPQGFHRETLLAAHERAGDVVATDDATLVEALGREVVGVPGADEAFKITTMADLARAEAVVHARAVTSPSVPGGLS